MFNNQSYSCTPCDDKNVYTIWMSYIVNEDKKRKYKTANLQKPSRFEMRNVSTRLFANMGCMFGQFGYGNRYDSFTVVLFAYANKRPKSFLATAACAP